MFKFSCLGGYVFKAWFMPFFGILLLITTIFLLQQVLIWLPRLIENDVPLALTVQLFSSLIPSILLKVLPMSYFFALYRVAKQLQSSSELDAMYAGGLSLFNIFKPILYIGILLSFVQLWVTMIAVPAGKLNLYNTSQQLSALQAEPSFVPKRFADVEGITFYSEGKNPNGSYSNVLISDARESIAKPQVYFAKEAFISKVSDGLAISLKDGNQISGEKDSLSLTNFDEYLIQVPLSFNVSIHEGTENTQFIFMRGQTLYDNMAEGGIKSVAEWNKRWMPPIVLIILFFIAIPLALQAKRSQKGGSFILALIILASIDQAQSTVFRKMGLEAIPLWSSWALMVLFAVIAVFLFMQVDKYGSLSLKHMKKVFP